MNFCSLYLKCHYRKLSKPPAIITYPRTQRWLPSLSLSHYMPLTETVCLLCQQTLMRCYHKMTINTQGLVFACMSHLWLFCSFGVIMEHAWASNHDVSNSCEYQSPFLVLMQHYDIPQPQQTTGSGRKKNKIIDLKVLLAFIITFLTPRILGHIYSTLLIFFHIRIT